MDHDTTGAMTRRTLLKSGAGVATAGAVTAASGAASAQQDAYDGYLEEVSNFDGETADATGMDEVTIDVGAGNQGLLMDPAAIVVDPGTTIRWQWTGNGGAHNVVHDVDDPTFTSRDAHDGDSIDEEGFVYEYVADEEGAHPYVCTPHRALEMKGVLVVGEDNVETDTFPFGEAEDGLNTIAIFGGAAVFGTAALLGISAYRDLFSDDESGH